MASNQTHTLLVIISLIITSTTITAQSWNLIWSDEFDNNISSDWVFDIGDGTEQGIPRWGNNEAQYYKRENATVVNGQLIITAKNEAFGGKRYTSARMKTQGLQTFRYGKVEARIALPAFSGSWPAFWALGSSITEQSWPSCGEIDIMEHADTSNTIHGTMHWSYFAAGSPNQWVFYSQKTDISNVKNFHTYSVEWDPEYIRWFIDGVQFNESLIKGGLNGTSEFQNDFFLLLNLAIGGNFVNGPVLVPTNEEEAQMKVDWVRVYEKVPAYEIPQTRRYEAEDFSFSATGISIDPSTDPLGDSSNGDWDPPLNIGMGTGNWLAYQYIGFPYTGSYTFRYRIASNEGGTLTTELDGGSTNGGVSLDAIAIPNTGGANTWQTITKNFTINKGIHEVGILISQGIGNINWFEIELNETLSTTNFTKKNVQIFPNPVTDSFRINTKTLGKAYKIYNSLGTEVLSGVVNSKRLNTTTLSSGIYFLTIENYNTFKFVKK